MAPDPPPPSFQRVPVRGANPSPDQQPLYYQHYILARSIAPTNCSLPPRAQRDWDTCIGVPMRVPDGHLFLHMRQHPGSLGLGLWRAPGDRAPCGRAPPLKNIMAGGGSQYLSAVPQTWAAELPASDRVRPGFPAPGGTCAWAAAPHHDDVLHLIFFHPHARVHMVRSTPIVLGLA